MKPLRVGIAGLGTVGATVARLIVDNGKALAARCGRELVLTAVSARTKGKDRGFRMEGVTWFDDPVKLATMADIDLFVELFGLVGRIRQENPGKRQFGRIDAIGFLFGETSANLTQDIAYRHPVGPSIPILGGKHIRTAQALEFEPGLKIVGQL
jgi:hypothetical protein